MLTPSRRLQYAFILLETWGISCHFSLLQQIEGRSHFSLDALTRHNYSSIRANFFGLVFPNFTCLSIIHDVHLLVSPDTSHLTFISEVQLFNYSMAQSPSWEANWFAGSQEIPRISRNPKVHYRTHKHPSPVSILGQPNPVHTTSQLLEIHPNIINPSTPRSPHWFLPSGFPTKTLYTTLSPPIRTTCPAHLIFLDFITRTILGEEYKLFSSSTEVQLRIRKSNGLSNISFRKYSFGEHLFLCYRIYKLTNTLQHNKYLLQYVGYMFRPVNRPSSGLQQNKSQVLFRYWDPNIFTAVNVHKIWYWIKCETYNVWLKQV